MTAFRLTRGASALWLACAATLIAVFLALGRVLFLFLFITIGPEAVLGQPWMHVIEPMAIYELPLLILLLSIPSTAVFAQRALVSGGKGSALFLSWSSALMVSLCHSYRFLAVVAALGVVVCVLRKRDTLRWALLIVASLLCVAPVDVSLRVFPEGVGPGFVPSYYAGFGWHLRPTTGSGSAAVPISMPHPNGSGCGE